MEVIASMTRSACEAAMISGDSWTRGARVNILAVPRMLVAEALLGRQGLTAEDILHRSGIGGYAFLRGDR